MDEGKRNRGRWRRREKEEGGRREEERGDRREKRRKREEEEGTRLHALELVVGGVERGNENALDEEGRGKTRRRLDKEERGKCTREVRWRCGEGGGEGRRIEDERKEDGGEKGK